MKFPVSAVLASALFALAQPGPILAQPHTDASPAHIAADGSTKISRFGICRNVTNKLTREEMMIPVRASEEWQKGDDAFLAEPREGTAVGPCTPPAYFVAGKRIYTPDHSSYEWRTSPLFGDAFGSGVWISPDGTKMAIGESGWSDRKSAKNSGGNLRGRVVFYDISDAQNPQVTSIAYGVDADNKSGSSRRPSFLGGGNFFISDDGTRLLSGNSRIYHLQNGTWSVELSFPTHWWAHDNGYVAMNPQGDLAIGNTQYDSKGNRATNAYFHDGTKWMKVTAPAGVTFARFDENYNLYAYSENWTTYPNLEGRLEIYHFTPAGNSGSFSHVATLTMDPSHAAMLPGQFWPTLVNNYTVGRDGTILVLYADRTLQTWRKEALSWKVTDQRKLSFGFRPVGMFSASLNGFSTTNGSTLSISGDGSVLWYPRGANGDMTQLVRNDATGGWTQTGSFNTPDYHFQDTTGGTSFFSQSIGLASSRDGSLIAMSNAFDGPTPGGLGGGAKLIPGTVSGYLAGSGTSSYYKQMFSAGSVYLFDQNP